MILPVSGLPAGVLEPDETVVGDEIRGAMVLWGTVTVGLLVCASIPPTAGFAEVGGIGD
jgi:hypothetical protein